MIDDTTWASGANARASGDSEAGTVNYYPWFRPGGGRYEVVTISSPTGARGVACYLPPSFDENPYAVYKQLLLLSDGNNVFNDSTAFGGRSWRAAATLDHEIGSGQISELVVFAVYNSPRRITEYTYVPDATYGGGGADDYLDWLEKDAVPALRDRYRISPAARLSILGSSLGGLLACYAGWSRPQTYSGSGCMSPSMWWASEDFPKNLLATARPNGPEPTIYLDSGDTGGDSNIAVSTLAVYREFQQLGWPYGQLWHYLDRGAGHNEASWGSRLALPLRVLFGYRSDGSALLDYNRSIDLTSVAL